MSRRGSGGWRGRGKARWLIRGKLLALLRRWANLDDDERTTVTDLLARNRRQAKAYLLKE